jgi:hypothetical protein
MVWVHDGYFYPDRHWRYLRDCGELGDNIEIDIADDPARLDLRWAKGLWVNVQGDDERRVGRLARCLADAGARRVVAAWHEIHLRPNGEWHCPAQRMTFSNDELSQWPA